MTGAPLLEVSQLRVHFPILSGLLRRPVGMVRAVDGISFEIQPGETFALVGESGCGKSTTGYAVLRMLQPTGGRVLFRGQDLTLLEGEALRQAQGEMQIVFQDPYSSLDPKMTVGESVGEPLLVRKMLSGAALGGRVAELLSLVGLRPEHAKRYPHEFSGGQRQRIGIARALALKPRLIICDEPVSALDVSVRSQILNLLMELKRELGVAYLFISHDLSVVRHVSDRVAVMYLGHIVEEAPVETLFATPAHPYTKALLSAIPVPDPEAQRARQPIVLQGDLPSPADPPSGCPFRTRCPIAREVCASDPPSLRPIGADHRVACHFAP
ncbi:MAG: ATP-binding cassette domain-containing protein [Proteobacteria bacterium]|nr:ATP-binding cassette domain-containing protein [Pseudomonadota bacterium]MBI3497304.1 ATP-binding cassette domain-containing protein [Pseudomonadota bacterium]